MEVLVKAKDHLLCRLKSLTRIWRFNHTLEPSMCNEMECFSHHVHVSKWKKVDASTFGVNRSMIPPSPWTVLRILRREGFQAYLVGGCVRDLLLKKVPKDFDVITTADLKQIKKQFYRSQIIGRRFPICRVYVKGSIIEVSSFKTVAANAKGKEEVILSQMPHGCDYQDLIRWRNSMHRDFTINSLFFDPFLNKIYDYANGITDLKSLKLRTLIPAHLSFKEDCARILRGLRLAARLGLSFCRDTETAIRSLSSSIEGLDKARIMMELNYMLSYGAAESSICMLRRYDLLQFFLPFHAAYLDQQNGKIPAENSIMLMKIFSNLDKLVSCDQPADYSLWVGLLAFHQALVGIPQNAFVVWVFASVLYQRNWDKGVKFAREHAKDKVKFVPEISGFSEIKPDEELAEKVVQLASSVQDCINGLTETHSSYVFVSKKVETNVRRIFDVLVNDIESYESEKGDFAINYNLLGMGNVNETRFVLGKIILETISDGHVTGEKMVDDPKKYLLPYGFKEDSLQNEFVSGKNRKRGVTPSSIEPKQKKERKLSEVITISEQEVVPRVESQQIGEDLLKVIETYRLPEEEIKATEEIVLEKKDYHPLSHEAINKKIDKQEKVYKEDISKLQLSSLFLKR